MQAFSIFDQQMMARALKLAAMGRFSTSPNPMVGCVITSRDGEILGEGWHKKAGGPHAEVHALQTAGEKARGATAYVTLEPCSHFGRTPPCANALIDAGVGRVVCAMLDSNPAVSGKGLAMLNQRGIATEHGLLATQARELNRGFFKRMEQGLPFVQVKLASSADGKTALANGQSKWITGAAARADVHQFRAAACAILTGSDTVLADNPSMNVRINDASPVSEPARQPLRVIIDTQHRVTPSHQIVNLPGEILIINGSGHREGFSEAVQFYAARLTPHGKVDVNDVLLELGRRQINNLWVEAGATLAGQFIAEGLADELVHYQAPVIMGNSSLSLLNLPAFEQMDQIIHLTYTDIRQIGADLRLIAQLT